MEIVNRTKWYLITNKHTIYSATLFSTLKAAIFNRITLNKSESQNRYIMFRKTSMSQAHFGRFIPLSEGFFIFNKIISGY